MRIIAGKFRGRRLVTPRGAATRPTTDRVREAMFSTLSSRFDNLQGTSVLDMFAGSGALGIEALSRGAHHVTFVESAPDARAALGRNVEALGVHDAVFIDSRDAFCRTDAPIPGAPFSLLFLDPPYRIEPVRIRELMEDLVCGRSIGTGAVVVYEHRTGVEPVWPTGFEDVGDRIYGQTTVSYAQLSAGKERTA
ncbi:MAG: 16S rRNA (guanine(966)-N(2))-methyltransferase RsmD [Coriobacteriia bacterium]|nr:16S rRNA (guanine(966)-N(2))-methyltransferase RsmD [Coriobacteriia bacterium]